MYAQNRCHQLFREEVKKSTDSNRDLQNQEKLIELMKFMDWFYQEKEELKKIVFNSKVDLESLPWEQKNRILAAQAKIDWYFIPLVSRQLRELNVEFVIRHLKSKNRSQLSDFLEIPAVIILPSKISALNRFSLGLDRLNKVRLVYSPFQLQKQAGAMYSPKNKFLYLHRESLFSKSFTSKSMMSHEVKHALFDAERNNEEAKIIVNYPVHIQFHSKKLSSDLYGSYFSFEELVAYAYSINSVAKDLIISNSDSDKSRLEKALFVTKSLSQRAFDSATAALKFVEMKDPFKVRFLTKSVEIEFASGETLILNIPQKNMVQYNEENFNYEYVKKELLKAQALAEFNLKYIFDAEISEMVVTRMARFRAAQVEFVESLNTEN